MRVERVVLWLSAPPGPACCGCARHRGLPASTMHDPSHSMGLEARATARAARQTLECAHDHPSSPAGCARPSPDSSRPVTLAPPEEELLKARDALVRPCARAGCCVCTNAGHTSCTQARMHTRMGRRMGTNTPPIAPSLTASVWTGTCSRGAPPNCAAPALPHVRSRATRRWPLLLLLILQPCACATPHHTQGVRKSDLHIVSNSTQCSPACTASRRPAGVDSAGACPARRPGHSMAGGGPCAWTARSGGARALVCGALP